MGVRKCPKCGSVWYTALPKCAFCGVEGEEVKGPISPAKLNLGKRGVESGPPPGHSASDRDLAASAEPNVAAAEPPKAEAPPPPPAPEPAKAEAPASFAPSREGASEAKPPPPPPPPEPPKETPVEPPKPVPPPVVLDAPSADEAIAKLKSKGYKPLNVKEKAGDASEPPAPLIPSATVPLVFGSLGLIAGLLLPLSTLVRHDKVLVTLSLLAWAILAPFAPFAWFTAQRYVDQCRALGFSPAAAAHTGKLLGMLASFLIVFEFSALAVFVAVQILSGKVVCPLWK